MEERLQLVVHVNERLLITRQPKQLLEIVPSEPTREQLDVAQKEQLLLTQTQQQALDLTFGVRGVPGPPGAAGAGGTNWPDVLLINTPGLHHLEDDRYIEVDCTLGDIELRLPSTISYLGTSRKIVRISDDENMVIVTPTTGDLLGHPSLDLAYKGDSYEFTARSSGWWL